MTAARTPSAPQTPETPPAPEAARTASEASPETPTETSPEAPPKTSRALLTSPTPAIPQDIPDLPPVPGIPVLFPSVVPASAVVGPVRHPWAAVFRLLVAAAAAAAVTVDMIAGPPLRVLSHFAVQSNIVLALVLLCSARRAWTARRPVPAALTGAVVLYVTLTALVHHLLLTRVSPPLSITGTPGTHPLWQSVAAHVLLTAVPIAALLDWLLLTAPGHLHLRQAPPWLLYPLAYLVFSLVRGGLLPPAAQDRYLYPFLDVARHGYKHVLANGLLLGLSFYGLALILVAADHTRPNLVRHPWKTGFRLRPPVG